MTSKLTDKQIEEISKINPFDFCDDGIIGCIGDNSGASAPSRDFLIAEGHKLNVDILYFSLRNEIEFSKFTGIHPYEDILVYPFWFSCRHTIEILLKLAIKRVNLIWEIKKTVLTQEQSNLYKKSLSSHKIKELTSIFENLVSIDIDTKEAFIKMEHFIDLIKDYFFDEEADNFRYTYKSDQKEVNLDGKRILNISILYEKFLVLYGQLDWFCNCVCVHLLPTYINTDTFTSKLNRSQIADISKKLPNISDWKSDKFDTAKMEICREYNLSSNEFSKVVDIIKKHREFSFNIGVEIKFKILSEKTIKALCELIKAGREINDVPLLEKCYLENGGIFTTIPDSENYSPENYKIKLKKEEAFVKKGNSFLGIASKDELAILHAFREIVLPFAFSAGYLSEELDMLFDSWRNKGIISDDYTINKLAFGFEKILEGLKKCGQATYQECFKKHLSD